MNLKDSIEKYIEAGHIGQLHFICDEFIQLVESYYREHRDLKFYAEQLSLTPKYISTTIKQVSGKSATEWIERYVTLDAITQLTSTQRSIKEI